MSKKILIILGHPLRDSFCGAIAEQYLQGAKSAGHDVELVALGELRFDPILHRGYRNIQELEPDLQDAQEKITSAKHLVFVYPTWWGTMPALLKGFIDRTFLPGYAFKYRSGSKLWDKLLKGKSAHLLVTMDTPPWYFRWIYRMPGHNEMKRTVLEFCGVHPVKVTSIGRIKDSKDVTKKKWLTQANQYGRNA